MPVELERIEATLRKRLPALGEAERRALARYLQLVGEYGKVLNLTAMTPGAELAELLVGEALRLHALAPLPAGAAVDLGSGNGSPAVPLAVLNPGVSFTAVEARARRAAFLGTVKALLGLDNLAVLPLRVEEVIARSPGSYSLVTSRAYAGPARFLPQARRLLAPEGEVRGFAGEALDEVRDAAAANGFEVVRVQAYRGPASTRHVYRLKILTTEDAENTEKIQS